MLRLVLALCLFLPQLSQALTLHDLNGQCGDHVRVILTNLYDTPMSTGIDEKGEYIRVDSDFLFDYPDDSVRFVFFHECGHRVNKHSKDFKPPGWEEVADCYAAKRFYREYGYTRLVKALSDMGNIHYRGRNESILRCLR